MWLTAGEMEVEYEDEEEDEDEESASKEETLKHDQLTAFLQQMELQYRK